ncbi:MAG TPA: DUF309 domain-containing protein [Chthoniobacteraceae bacterium]|jgi:hypothetical protein|nr:DUF309 domain-containing protein [Chthoniobacteraceae bacterium]
MKKNERITAFVQGLDLDPREGGDGMDAHYTGYFACFNAGQYYEAHDVLEHLWLRGCGEEHAFYKGLIQIAGAFVHLRKQYLRPEHPKDGKRLRPAVRLFELGERNVAPYGPRHLGLDVAALLALCRATAGEIIISEFTRNPWHPDRRPQLTLEAAS